MKYAHSRKEHRNMPTYDYKCSSCNKTFEFFQKMTDNPLTECPDCGGKLKRIIGAGAGPIFKGSGFYHTDYKNNSENKKAGSNSSKKTTSGNSKNTVNEGSGE
jgi:putative FmdB family regulatory protein